MKKNLNKLLLAVAATLFSASITLAQAPQAIPYQAAVRNSKGVVLAFKTIGLRFTVLDTVAGARQVVYQETMPAVTNALGLFMVNIGQGVPVTGTFSGINWGATASMYIQVELDTSGYHGNDPNTSLYVVIGTQQMMSVPYALYANYATNSTTSVTATGNGVPTGTIEAFAGPVANIPSGWVLCAGQALSCTTYPGLFKAIGYSWGNPGNGNFNLPMTLGLFLRGQQNGGGYDPDAGTRIASQNGGNNGDGVGSFQYDAFQGHKHFSGVNTPNNLGSNSVGGTYTASQTGVLWGSAYSTTYPGVTSNPLSNDNSYGSPRISTETRPRNVYVNYMIKL